MLLGLYKTEEAAHAKLEAGEELPSAVSQQRCKLTASFVCIQSVTLGTIGGVCSVKQTSLCDLSKLKVQQASLS
jgi:hypothetical protein